jgi:glycosyltransferase involved in cell wall biosynthesis
MRFSVVIPVYNRTVELRRCLESVAAQSFEDFETIVVDDGSEADIAGAVQGCNLPIRLLRLPDNRGAGAARNAGIAAAEGEYITFLDSDDTWFPWTLAVYDQSIRKYDRPGFVAGRVVSPEDGQVSSPPKLVAERYEDYYRSSGTNFFIGTCATAIQTAPLRDIGGFKEDRMNSEDSDLWLRLGTVRGFVRILEPPVFHYHRTEKSLIDDIVLAQTGVTSLIANERKGDYPGGLARRKERRKIISGFVRPHIVARLRSGERRLALQLYRSVFGWLVADCRFRFLLGFWVLFMTAPRRRTAVSPD